MLENLKRHLWGFNDICFKIVDFTILMISGDKYDICNKIIPGFIYFACSLTGNYQLFDNKAISNDKLLEKYYSKITTYSDKKFKYSEHSLFLVFLKNNNMKYSLDGYDILSHSHGQLGFDEIYRIKFGDFEKINLVDIVIFPKEKHEIELLFIEAKKNNYKIIPYGGGTNVTGCLMVNKDLSTDKNLYISLDMRYYNNILYTDLYNNYAIIQSGACGKEIEDYLNKIGYTMGHEPDSYEFSTLGGWISTYASGMRRNKYGNIEEIVIDFGYVNDKSKNVIDKDDTKTEHINIVRNSQGVKIQNLFFGHEGNFGIITDVIVNIKKLPETKSFEAVIFYSMKEGIQFLKEVNDSELKPSSIRLVDNEQFKFGQALKPQKTDWFEIFVDKLKKFYLISILGYDVDKMVACTLMIEGNKRYCDFILNEIKKIATKYHGLMGGSENGKSGYNLTHAIAYIRDFMIDYNAIGETFETSIEWDKIEDMAESVKKILHLECIKYTPYKSLFSYRISQCYNTGCCVYFTVGFIKNIDTTAEEAINNFHKLEKIMRKVMIEKGGSISHHHGIGQIKSHELDKSQIPVIQSIKDMFDETNVFCNNNYLHNC